MGSRKKVLGLILTVLLFSVLLLPTFGIGQKNPTPSIKIQPPPAIKPGGSAASDTPPKAEALKPDLKVEAVGLDSRCRITFRLKNAGRGAIPEQEHSQGRVLIAWDQGKQTFPFKELDPGRALIKPGGSVDFTTPIILSKEARVEVSLDTTGRIHEIIDLNNQKTARLQPRCAPAVAQTLLPPTEAGPAGKAFSAESARIELQRPAYSQSPQKLALGIAPHPPGIEKGGDLGIQIFSPRTGDRFPAAQNLLIDWDFSPGISCVAPSVTISLSSTSDTRFTYTVPNQPHSKRFSIPATNMPGTYLASVRCNEFVGYAGNFELLPADSLVILQPSDRLPTTLEMGQSYQVQWAATGGIRDRMLKIELLSASQGPRVLASGVPANAGVREVRLPHTCSPDLPSPYGGTKHIKLTTEGRDPRETQSNLLTILQPRLIMDQNAPGLRNRWRIGTFQDIRWSAQNVNSNLRLRIDLMKGSESWLTIATDVPANGQRFRWQVGYEGGSGDMNPYNMGGPPPPPLGDDYWIRIRLNGCNQIWARSPVFTIEP